MTVLPAVNWSFERMPSAPVAVLIGPSVAVKSKAAITDVAIFMFLTSFLCGMIIDIAKVHTSRTNILRHLRLRELQPCDWC